MLENKSGLHPLGQAVLLIPYEAELMKPNQLIQLPESYRKQMQSVESRAIVLEIGPDAWWSEGGARPRAKVGDKVMISKYSGALAEGSRDALTYRIVNADDIYCRIEDNLDVEAYVESRK